MEPLTACIGIIFITSGITGIAIYDYYNMLIFIKNSEKKQLNIEKLKKELSKGK